MTPVVLFRTHSVEASSATNRMMSCPWSPDDPRTPTGSRNLERGYAGTQAVSRSTQPRSRRRVALLQHLPIALRMFLSTNRCPFRRNIRSRWPRSFARIIRAGRINALPAADQDRGIMEQIMSVLDAVLSRIDQDLEQSLDRLFALLRIASISPDPAYKAQCRAAAEHVAKDLASIGFDCSVRPTAGHPVVVGKGGNGSGPRTLFYGHYDVQPVDPLDLWETPPFEPRIAALPDGRKVIRARGACDDKGQLMTFVEACRAFKAVTGKLPLPITMMIEGEEECGSANLFGFVRDKAAQVRLDMGKGCDTGMWDREAPSLTTALRGLVYEEVRVRAADRDLHSGLFGGAARNPIHLCADVITALHDK